MAQLEIGRPRTRTTAAAVCLFLLAVGADSRGTAMNTRSGAQASAENRLKELGITLPAPPEPFGAYAEAVRTGNLLFLSGMLPTEGREVKFVGRVGAELDAEAGRKAARLAASTHSPSRAMSSNRSTG